MEPVPFLEEIVRCYSPSREEGGVAMRAVEAMQSLGFRKAYVDAAGNAIGVVGNPAGRTVMLIGHIDTVPGEIPVRREVVQGDEKLFGRGSVDAKGSFATFVQAASRLPVDAPVQFIVVGAVEEEVRSSKGARHLLQSFPEPEFVIIGEPSGGNGITLGYKGRLLQEVHITREMAHSASQFLSVGDYLSLWSAHVHSRVAEKNAGRQPGFRTLDVTVQKLSVSNDGFKEVGELELGFRLGPEFDPHELDTELTATFAEWIASLPNDPTCQVRMECCQHEVPAEYSKKSDLAGAFRKAMRAVGVEPRHVVKTGTSDMNVLARGWGCAMVAYGPGDSALDHTPHEHISLAEYLKSIDILEQVLLSLNEKLA
ncbi:MAG: [LysW]-lysine hydrolase [Bdellovibrionales bacterium]|nr:[LysW]-lysine hydrolase [Bdellovibrionales bacterium]